MMNYFLRAFSNTHFARSYLTDSRCASPIRIVSRIKSCLENSSLSETCASSLSNSSDKRKLIMMGSLFLSFMVKKYLKTLHLNQIEKSAGYHRDTNLCSHTKGPLKTVVSDSFVCSCFWPRLKTNTHTFLVNRRHIRR